MLDDATGLVFATNTAAGLGGHDVTPPPSWSAKADHLSFSEGGRLAHGLRAGVNAWMVRLMRTMTIEGGGTRRRDVAGAAGLVPATRAVAGLGGLDATPPPSWSAKADHLCFSEGERSAHGLRAGVNAWMVRLMRTMTIEGGGMRRRDVAGAAGLVPATRAVAGLGGHDATPPPSWSAKADHPRFSEGERSAHGLRAGVNAWMVRLMRTMTIEGGGTRLRDVAGAAGWVSATHAVAGLGGHDATPPPSWSAKADHPRFSGGERSTQGLRAWVKAWMVRLMRTMTIEGGGTRLRDVAGAAGWVSATRAVAGLGGHDATPPPSWSAKADHPRFSAGERSAHGLRAGVNAWMVRLMRTMTAEGVGARSRLLAGVGMGAAASARSARMVFP